MPFNAKRTRNGRHGRRKLSAVPNRWGAQSKHATSAVSHLFRRQEHCSAAQVWEDIEKVITEQGENDEARLNPTCDWHATCVISTLRATQARVQAFLPQVRGAAAESTGKPFYEQLQNMAGGRIGVILPVLHRRARRWSEPAEEIVQAVITFATTKPPPEQLTSALRTALYAWCIASRFARQWGLISSVQRRPATRSSTACHAQCCAVRYPTVFRY